MPSLLETILYTPDPIATARFYMDIIGLRLLEEPNERMAALRIDEASVLLLFEPTWSARPGRDVPSHGAMGPGHIGFRVDDLDAWPARLAECGIEIEMEFTWPEGFFRKGRSIYFRDPAGNSVELLSADIWPSCRVPALWASEPPRDEIAVLLLSEPNRADAIHDRVFADAREATEYIARGNYDGGLLTGYFIDDPGYDRAVRTKCFKPKRQHHVEPSFIASFCYGISCHWHVEGTQIDAPEDLEEFNRHCTTSPSSNLWIFTGQDASFPSAVFSTRDKALSWVEHFGITGTLVEHQLSDSGGPSKILICERVSASGH